MGEPEIAAGDFKARCLHLMDQVQSTKVPLIITKRGKPVARLVPIDSGPAPLFGAMRGTITYQEDLIAPIDEVWEADV